MELASKAGYIAGAVIAAIILVYLVYSMFKPEKF
jgi:K+-transporting ATPase KdpF subunit